MFFYPDDSEILETWNPNSSFKYFWVIRIEKQIRSFAFWEKFLARQFCFGNYWPLAPPLWRRKTTLTGKSSSKFSKPLSRKYQLDLTLLSLFPPFYFTCLFWIILVRFFGGFLSRSVDPLPFPTKNSSCKSSAWYRKPRKSRLNTYLVVVLKGRKIG